MWIGVRSPLVINNHSFWHEINQSKSSSAVTCSFFLCSSFPTRQKTSYLEEFIKEAPLDHIWRRLISNDSRRAMIVVIKTYEFLNSVYNESVKSSGFESQRSPVGQWKI